MQTRKTNYSGLPIFVKKNALREQASVRAPSTSRTPTSSLQAPGQASASHAHTMQYSRVCVGQARPATFNKRGKTISAFPASSKGQSESKEEHSSQPRVVLKIGRRLGVGAYGS